jgi:hypothetical protein
MIRNYKLLSFLLLVIVQTAVAADRTEVQLKLYINANMPNTVNKIVSPPSAPCDNSIDVLKAYVKKNYVYYQEVTTSVNKNGFIREEISLPNKKPQTQAEIDREQLTANFLKLGGDPIALRNALCFFDENKNTKFKAAGDPSRSGGISIDNQRYITINDMTSSMSKSRFYVLDLQTNKVETYFSAHGYGGKKGVQESDMEMEQASNTDGSNASPRGFFITGTRREGSSDPRWKFSMKLHGLQQGINDKSFSRAIIMHPFPKMPDESASSDDPAISGAIRSEGPFSLSQGCTMLSEKYASDIINKIKAPSNSKGGSLYYNYSKLEKYEGGCHNVEGLMKK